MEQQCGSAISRPVVRASTLKRRECICKFCSNKQMRWLQHISGRVTWAKTVIWHFHFRITWFTLSNFLRNTVAFKLLQNPHEKKSYFVHFASQLTKQLPRRWKKTVSLIITLLFFLATFLVVVTNDGSQGHLIGPFRSSSQHERRQ